MIIHSNPTYKCEHCRKLYQIKSACEKHEVTCSRNPDNDRPCFTCRHCKKVRVEHHWDHYDARHSSFINILHCNKKQHYLIPVSSEHKGNGYLQEDINDGEKENLPMPRQCDVYNEDNYYPIEQLLP